MVSVAWQGLSRQHYDWKHEKLCDGVERYLLMTLLYWGLWEIFQKDIVLWQIAQ